MVSVVAGAPAGAESLADAVALAYQTNPTLKSDRAQLKALDQSYGLARSGWWPSLTLDADRTRQESPQATVFGTTPEFETNRASANLTLTQPLFTGGRVSAAVKAAEADVMAGRQALVGEEQIILQRVIGAYADVLRDESVLATRQAQLAAVSQNLDETQARFASRDVTETDVLQSQAQVESVRTQLLLAQAQLEASRAAYKATVGQDPGKLDEPSPLPQVPGTLDQAFAATEAGNPTLLRAMFAEASSRQRIAEAKAANRPTVSLSGRIGSTSERRPFNDNYDHAVTAQATLTQPLVSGANLFTIGRARAQNESDQDQIEVERRAAIQSVSQAWSQMVANRAGISSSELAVTAATKFFDDMKLEYRFGQRGTLDVLNAEQTLRNAEISLATTRHDAFVAQAGVLAAIGKLSAQDLAPGVTPYDPQASFKAVKRTEPPWVSVVGALDGLEKPAPR